MSATTQAKTVGSTGAIGRLVEQLAKLPGIGPKTAERLAHYLVRTSREEALALAEAIRQVKEGLHPCRQCHNLAEDDLCAICADPRRDPSTICVVEEVRDVAALEKAGVYKGLYHVLGGHLSPLDNIGPEQLHVESLLRRVQTGQVREVILAMNPNLEGEGTALYISQLLAPTGVRLTRLARGLPAGSSLEMASKDMLIDALEGRRSI